MWHSRRFKKAPAFTLFKLALAVAEHGNRRERRRRGGGPVT
jgi:hypothetical protein